MRIGQGYVKLLGNIEESPVDAVGQGELPPSVAPHPSFQGYPAVFLNSLRPSTSTDSTIFMYASIAVFCRVPSMAPTHTNLIGLPITYKSK